MAQKRENKKKCSQLSWLTVEEVGGGWLKQWGGLARGRCFLGGGKVGNWVSFESEFRRRLRCCLVILLLHLIFVLKKFRVLEKSFVASLTSSPLSHPAIQPTTHCTTPFYVLSMSV